MPYIILKAFILANRRKVVYDCINIYTSQMINVFKF